MPRLIGLAHVALAGGLGLSVLGLIDARLSACLWWGPLLAFIGALVRRTAAGGFLAALALCYSLAGFSGPEFRADTGSYFVYLRSLAFDRDVDFANDWRLLGQPAQAGLRSPTGLVPNSQTLGPAVLWSPFYALAHVYVRLTGTLGLGQWSADGTDAPYRRSLAMGTIAMVLLGSCLLAKALARHVSRGPACLGVAAAVLGSPVVYYTFVAPGMAHGLAFGLAAVLLFALDLAWEARGRAAVQMWLAVGGLLGLLVLVRTQAVVLALVVLPVALLAWLRGQVALKVLLAAGLLAGLVFAPQMFAWKAIFGSFVTVPQGSRYLDGSSPHLWDVLFSANHGLFPHSPVLALGIVGLLLAVRRHGVFASGALAAFVALAWTNGSVADWDWEGGDAFGARRFDVAVPLCAVGLGALAAWSVDLARRRPLLLPAFGLGLLALWNLGFVAIFRSGRYPEAAPLDRVARDQALLVRRIAAGLLGSVSGTRGRAAAYGFFSGEYFFGALGSSDGALRLASADDRTLGPGFSAPSWREDGPAFRWAVYPEACLTLPLNGDRSLGALGVLARAPRKALPQTVTVILNGVAQGSADLGAQWTTLRFALAEGALRAGENQLCLRFARGRPSGDDRPAAAVAEVRLARTLDDIAPAAAAESLDEGPEPRLP